MSRKLFVETNEEVMEKRTSLNELALLFLRLGSTSFGGPAVHIAMMEDEVVHRRNWLTHQQFLDMLAATNLIPGPNSTEMAIHVGFQRAGFRGLFVAGIAFIAPAVLIVSLLSWFYVRYGNLPLTAAFLYGIKPVVLAIVIQALFRLSKSTLKSRNLVCTAILALIMNFSGMGELYVLFLAAITSAVVFPFFKPKKQVSDSIASCWGLIPALVTKPFLFSMPPILSAASVVASIQLWQLFLVFLKAGSVLFGSGYVLLAFLRADLVEKLGWLSEAQLLDAIVVGQITPGPVFTTATFIGYLLSGPSGALVATIGIFLPAFFFVAISAPLLPYLRRSFVVARILDGLNAASLALMAVVTIRLTPAAVVDWTSASVMLISAASLLLWKVNSSWLVMAGGIVGLLSFSM